MARLQLRGGARQFYEKALHESEEGDIPAARAEGSPILQGSRRRQRCQSSSVSPGQAGGAQAGQHSTDKRGVSTTANTSDTPGTGYCADPTHDDVHAEQNRPAASTSAQGPDRQESDEQGSDSTGTATSGVDDSDGASDLEGLPVASAGGIMAPAAKKQKKKAKTSASHVITEEGMASKLGIAFSRVLQRSNQQGVMQGSKSVQKRRREEEAEAAQLKLARLERKERRTRGHAAVPPKGHDPAQDACEKTLVSTATKGVVQLFNAISKAQAARRQADAAGEKKRDVVKSTKAALLGVLKPDLHKGAESKAPGWRVLQQGFTGMHEAGKLKDLDREGSGEDISAEEIEDLEGSDNVDEW